MLMNINYLCFASTGDVLSLLQICRQSARVFQLTQPQMFRSLGLSQMHSQPSYLLSCQVPHFPLSLAISAHKESVHTSLEMGHQFPNGPPEVKLLF